MKIYQTLGYKTINNWLALQNRKPFFFQEETWQHIAEGKSGLVNAPTGYGKTYSVFLGTVIRYINNNPLHFNTKKNNGLQLLWVTPLRALAKDIGRAMEEAISAIGLPWQIGIRNGDTTINERAKQKRDMPEIMIITPESLMLLLAMKDNSVFFKTLRIIAVDEWHELIGSKRGVQVELAISRLVNVINRESSIVSDVPNNLQVWGISATIGNLEEAKDVLLSPLFQVEKSQPTVIIKANLPKKIAIESIFPDEIEKFPWAGHLGIKLADKLLPIIRESRTTLIFINTRGMSERWYQTLLDIAPDLAGAIALHHGSIEQDLRNWVEDALHQGILKAVVCTASLDLGVDFRPVETVVQVGSPKGVARFLQRAGRSGHQPGAVSKIYFLPTHSLELTEAAALKAAVDEQQIESRDPMILCYDVLIQYLCTLAVGEGFRPEHIYPEIKSTFCFSEITDDDWQQILQFLINGGNALQQYDDYKKVVIEDGIYKIVSRRMAMRHRMHIGTIVSDSMLKVKFISGGYIGVIEEYFISRLDAGDVFTLAGRNLELVQIKDMTVLVRKSNAKKSIVPSWNGGRMPLSSKLSALLRRKIGEAADLVEETTVRKRKGYDVELQSLIPLFELQKYLSHIPRPNELLIEHIETKDGYHLFVYPFEGRLVHEAMSALLAYRIGKQYPMTFSIAMNDYGFELLSDQPIPMDDSNVLGLISTENLIDRHSCQQQ